MAFYDEMADMARDLLQPDTNGGLGQGRITIARVTQNDRPPELNPWDPWTGTVTTRIYLLRGAVSGVSMKYVDGETILATDQMLICADWMQLISTKVGDDPATTSATMVTFDLSVGDIINVDGSPLTTIKQISIPGAGVKAAYKFVVRG